MAKRKKGKGARKKVEPGEVRRFRVHWRAYFIITSVLLVFTAGTIGFMYLEPGMSAWDAFHLTMQTITTVGYGDVEIQTNEGRLFSDVLMIVGLGIATFGLASLLEFIVSGKLTEIMRSRDYEYMVSRLKNHVIVCGYGRVGKAAVEELEERGVPVVVIDRCKETLEDLDADVARMVGDVTHDDDLLRCGVKRAVAIIAAAGDDAVNLMTVVTAKYIKSGIIAIVRSSVDEDKEKFQKVGADMVISPETEGGKSMARMLSEAKNLVIVAGYGRVGSACARELKAMGIPVIVMEPDNETLGMVHEGIERMDGDVTKEVDLRKAGIMKADALVSTCGPDASNLLATVTAKYHKPSITVISRASSPEDVSKILKVGADIVISPESEGGRSIAQWAAQAYELAVSG